MIVQSQVVVIRRHRRQGGGVLRTETWLHLPVYLIRPGDEIEDPRNQAGETVEICQPHGRMRYFWRLRAGSFWLDLVGPADRFWVLRPENNVRHEEVAS